MSTPIVDVSETEATRGQGHIGLAQGTALYIASVLGTGLLVLPGLAAGVAGPASVVAVIAVLVLSVPLAGTFAVLAARYPDPGGVASYVRRALGDTAARIAGYWFMFGVCVGAPVVAVLGGEYVAAIAGIDRAFVPVIAAAVFVPPFAVNLLGVRVAGWVQLALTALLLSVVVGVVAIAAPAVEPQNSSRSSRTAGRASQRRSVSSSGPSRGGRSARTSPGSSAGRAATSRSRRRSHSS